MVFGVYPTAGIHECEPEARYWLRWSGVGSATEARKDRQDDMQYILLVRLTPEGIDATLENSQMPLEAERSVSVPGVSALGIYAVLGPYDFTAIIDAPDNDSAARWSIAFSSKIRGEITTMPAVPISHLQDRGGGTDVEQTSEPLPGQAGG